MALEFKKAKRSLAKVKIAIGGPSGSGKTMSALLLAYGLIHAEHPNWSDADCWDKVCIIDTENMSGSLYVNTRAGAYRTGEYNTIDIEPPFEPQKYMDAIHMAEDHNMEVIIIDSFSHVWSGEGGILDKQGKIAERSGNSYTSWRSVTPEHNRLMDTVLQSRCHVVVNMRAKMEYVQEKNDKGKTTVRAVGMGLIQRDNSQYEYTTVFMLDDSHTANAQKDRTGIFDGKFFTITPETGKAFAEWLSSGEPVPTPAPQIKKAEAIEVKEEEVVDTEHSGSRNYSMQEIDTLMKSKAMNMTAEQKNELYANIKEVCGVVNYHSITDQNTLNKIYNTFKED